MNRTQGRAMNGRVVGTYKMLEKIGEGGMGAVYRGVDQMLERAVAIKVLRPELAGDANVVARFRSEAVTLARLNHPRVATLYSFFQEGEHQFMVMEFVPGESLDRVIERSGPMPLKQATSLFLQALEGIRHAHGLGIVHRDIKPANVMITPSGAVKVMDFGIARVLGSARATRTGRLVGTLEYMAPEQIRGEGGDERSDIYALGILLYEMLTGRVPFDQDSDYSLMRAQVEQAPPPPRTIVAGLPETVEQVILRALEKAPADRYQTVAELQEALRQAVDVSVTSDTAAPSLPRATRLAAGVDEEHVHVKETRSAVDAGASGMRATRLREVLNVVRDGSFGRRQVVYAGTGAGVLMAIILILAFSRWTAGPAGEPTSEVAEEEVVKPSQDGVRSPIRSSGSEAVLASGTADQAPVSEQPPSTPSNAGMRAAGDVMSLLTQAHEHFEADRLTTPAGENAVAYCRRVLEIDPQHVGALELMRRIAARYESWGDQRMEESAFAAAAARYETSLSVMHTTRVATKLEKARQATGGAEPNPSTSPGQAGAEALSGLETQTGVPSTPRTVTIPAGTVVTVQLTQALTPINGDEEGHQVRFRVSRDVVVGGRVVVRAGTPAYGVITAVRRARALLRGELRFEVRTVTAVDGRDLSLHSESFGMKAGRGEDAFIKAGGQYRAVVSQGTTVTTN